MKLQEKKIFKMGISATSIEISLKNRNISGNIPAISREYSGNLFPKVREMTGNISEGCFIQEIPVFISDVPGYSRTGNISEGCFELEIGKCCRNSRF